MLLCYKQRKCESILACNILPDHVYLVVDDAGISTSEIVQKLKGYSSYLYNRTIKRSGALWASGYSDTYLDNERHLMNAIQYVKDNHLKHQEKRGNQWQSKDMKSLLLDMKRIFGYQ